MIEQKNRGLLVNVSSQASIKSLHYLFILKPSYLTRLSKNSILSGDGVENNKVDKLFNRIIRELNFVK